MKSIPKSFQLGGHTIEVRFVTDDEMQARAGIEAYGLFVPDELTIYLLAPSRKLKTSIVMQTFWHEFAHAAFWVMGHKDYTNEPVVDHLGHLLHQLHQTKVKR